MSISINDDKIFTNRASDMQFVVVDLLTSLVFRNIWFVYSLYKENKWRSRSWVTFILRHPVLSVRKVRIYLYTYPMNLKLFWRSQVFHI